VKLTILSGGQTGADQGALRAARSRGVPTGGWAPRGFLTESGPAPWLEVFGLRQLPNPDYAARTRANVLEASALLWFGNPNSNGGRLTLRLARVQGIRHYVSIYDSTPLDVLAWLEDYVFTPDGDPVKLLVAGNRESINQGIGRQVQVFLAVTLDLLGDKVDRLPPVLP
jgi:hypothetical protein